MNITFAYLLKFLLINLLFVFIVACGSGDTTPTPPPAVTEGKLNKDFGSGIGFTSLPGSLPGGNRGNAVIIDKQNRILVAGQRSEANTNHAAIWRFTTDGQLDTSFGAGNGFVQHNVYDASYATSISIDDNDNIVVTGYSNKSAFGDDMVTWRYTSTGELDPSFGAGEGYVIFDNAVEYVGPAPVIDRGRSVVIDSQGKLVVAGFSQPSAYPSELVVWRLLSDGTPDNSFGTNGIVRHTGVEQSNSGFKLSTTSDNKIVVAGISKYQFMDTSVLLLRLQDDGQLDTTFSEDGIHLIYDSDIIVSDKAEGFDMEIDSQNRILVTANTRNQSMTAYHFTLWRFNSTGTPDTLFGDVDGIVQIENPPGMPKDGVLAMAIDAQSNILITAEQYNTQTFNADLAIWRLKDDGNLDTDFGTDGLVSHNTNPDSKIGNQDRGTAMILTQDGKILVTGYSEEFSIPTSLTLWQFK